MSSNPAGLYGEFWNSQGYTVEFCLKRKEQKRKEKMKMMTKKEKEEEKERKKENREVKLFHN